MHRRIRPVKGKVLTGSTRRFVRNKGKNAAAGYSSLFIRQEILINHFCYDKMYDTVLDCMTFYKHS